MFVKKGKHFRQPLHMMPKPSRQPLHGMPRRPRGKIRVSIGFSLLAVAAIGVGYPLWWNNRSSSGAAALLKNTSKQLIATAYRQRLGQDCIASPGPGVLQVAKISLTAPVQQGLGNSVLDISIGHDPLTPWPGPTTTALFAAHDVSFFSHLSQLKPGDTITYTVPCATYTFAVTGAVVTKPGASVPISKGGGVVLDTCWPPNALWYTPDRYVVTARYVGTKPQGSIDTSSTVPSLPTVKIGFAIPQGLNPALLILGNNTQMMGEMQFSGTPSSYFEQSNAPLVIEATALQGWFGVIHALEASSQSWWRSLAPSVTYPTSLSGVNLSSTSALSITEDIDGTTATGVTLSGGLNHRLVSVTESISNNELSITNVTFGA
ncbi:class D sortase [Acidithrix sp. C25]|uniref:class D sortase n=1 Tax=Acidithrix sp. C25 TaxID=1671482 RepID=UPI00191B9E31|nr:class D sortase [Acidithrix sp. C25]CAG4906163.1 unnamed protein product [Acidithrix sp. C25]